MGTILFSDIVFGPLKSRRLGSSLGINLLPRKGKLCNFDCLYCECGFNADGKGDPAVPEKELVIAALLSKLKELSINNISIDSITFSGNGEPTMHPGFSEIVESAISLRDMLTPAAKVSVLTNGSRLGVRKVSEALLKTDNPIIKIDSGFEKTVNLINRPLYPYSTKQVIENLDFFRKKFVLQTMFVRGIYRGQIIDNTTPEEISAWQKLVTEIEPREIMIYTIDRETPAKNLEKVSVEDMEMYAAPLLKRGYKVTISG
ncbi:MAG: radical SAM protein [Bacteroidales bacterium]|nr:radical SAM protein [Bacteroidales bacterium]MDD3989280.1 radical SAM protein [Bacteroidales bacterium]MDD4638587.1 radical SAM protein [Bacteroidales bacterium]